MHTLVTARLRLEPLVVAHCRATTSKAGIDARNARSRRLVERPGFRLADGDVPPGDVLYVR